MDKSSNHQTHAEHLEGLESRARALAQTRVMKKIKATFVPKLNTGIGHAGTREATMKLGFLRVVTQTSRLAKPFTIEK